MEMIVTGEGIKIVRIEGMLDGQSAPAAESAIRELIDGGANRILFNLEALSYISSAGLRVLLVAAKMSLHRNGAIRICSATSEVMKVLEISGFHNIMTITATESEGLQGL